MRKLLSYILLLAQLVGCTPKVQPYSREFSFPEAPQWYQPIESNDFSMSTAKAENNSEPLVMGAVELSRMATRLQILKLKFSELNLLSDQVQSLLLDEWPVDFVSAEKSAYFDMVIEQALPKVQSTVRAVSLEISDDKADIAKAISRIKIRLPPNGASIKQIGEAVLKGLDSFLIEIDKEKISNLIRDPLKLEVTKQKESYHQLFADLNRASKENSSLYSYSEAIIRELSEARIPLGKKDLTKAKNLGRTINQIKDEQSALKAIIAIWSILDKSSRKAIIGKMSPDLYNYLSGQDQRELECLAEQDCGNVFDYIVKNIGIFPKIKKYGVAKIKSTMNKNSVKYIEDKLKLNLREVASSFPLTLRQKVFGEISYSLDELNKFGKNFEKGLRERLPEWANKTFFSRPPGATWAPGGYIRYRIQNGQVELTNLAAREPTPQDEGAWLSFIIASLSSSFTIRGEEKQMLYSLLNWSAQRYREAKPSRQHESYNSIEQMEYLAGVTSLAAYTADWRSSNFTEVLGSHTLSEIFKEFPKEAMNHPLFPKREIFPLTLANLGNALRAFEHNPSPIFLVDNQMNLQLLSSTTESVAVMAGLADIEKGEMHPRISSNTISRTILAITQFLDSMEDISRAKAEVLSQPREDGQTPIEQIHKARGRLRNFVLGLANFLVKVMADKNGLIADHASLNSLSRLQDPKFHIMNQALAIQALQAASITLRKDIYQWEAIRLISILNAKFFNPQFFFYELDPMAKPNLPEVIEMIYSLEILKSQLPLDAGKFVERVQRSQLSWISRLKFVIEGRSLINAYEY